MPKIFKDNFEKAIVILALVFATSMTWYVNKLGLMLALTDHNAHLNFARLTFDSFTPGLSQIGFWPPLLHILMIPAAAIMPLYTSGLAGVVTLFPFYLLGAILLYRLILLLTQRNGLAFLGSVMFLANPYVLYYTVTPMMEVLFISNLIAVAYLFALWIEKRMVRYLILCGVFVSLACLSRFEGLALLPLLVILIVLTLAREKKRWAEIEATGIIFGFLALIGLAFILSFSWAYSGNPLTFAGGGWWLRSPLEEDTRSKGNIILSLKYLFASSSYMFTKALAIVSLASFMITSFVSKKRFVVTASSLILFSPFLFDLSSLFNGIPLLIPEFPLPYGVYVNKILLPEVFLNERYGMYWIGFAIVTPLILIGSFASIYAKSKFLNFLNIALRSSLIMILTSITFYHLYSVSVVDKFKTIRFNMGVPSNEQIEAGQYLKENYDYGKILLTRVDNDPVLVKAGIPLKNYVTEGSHLLYDQVRKQPWFFARWVIIYNQNDPQGDNWARQKEPLSIEYSSLQIFHKYYDEVFKNDKKIIYKINDDAIRDLSYEQGYNLSQIPSVNPQLTRWDSLTIYSKIETPDPSQVSPLPTKDEIISGLKMFYESDLKPNYKDGFYIDSRNVGTSESQSYALLQSYWAGDRETFDKVWRWTKENLQRETDHLFSWQFEYSSASSGAQIIDKNSATDADTDIAYALIKAGEDWGNEEYLTEAMLIIKDLWEVETASVNGKRYVIAGNWANTESQLVLNPSYFSPSSYKLFARYDTDNDWESLANDGYEVLDRVSGEELRGGIDIFLPPNWAVLDKKTGSISTFKDKIDALDYSLDAFRTLWRVSADQKLYPNNQAESYLGKVRIFEEEWEKNKQFCTIYRFNEGGADCEFTSSTLAGPLALLSVTEPRIAREVVEKYFMPGGNITLPESISFYYKSWYWFGLMLWTDSNK